MKLKAYQADTLAILRRFFEEARVAGPKAAYERIVAEPEHAARLGRMGGEYRPLDALPGVPYVCLRLPTGGGKTILAAHTVDVARDAWVEKDYPVVLWLVPTKTIRDQTVEALKNARHPYREVLDEAFDGRVRVFNIADFEQIRPQDIRDHLCVIVGTIQSLRVRDTEGRKVYAHNENLEPHFAAIPPAAPGLDLERVTDGPSQGDVKYSFANLLHIHRPLMIVDEAHNAVTGLSREMQARVNPATIVEFTATPRVQSNTLHSVSAQELKREDMVKLPIVLAEHGGWEAAVSGAIARRAQLDQIADRDYIRPIVLFQAQPRDETVTVEVLRKHLVEVENIPEAKIAVATGDQRELDGINLFDDKCEIEYIITVEALKEGWDCSFAYVFCSVARIHSPGAVEQLLGRVLRMPYATRRKAPELNKAYAYLSEPSFGAAARGLVDRLVAMGFDEGDAHDNIEAVQQDLAPGELFAERERPVSVFSHPIVPAKETIEALGALADIGVGVREGEDGAPEITVIGPVDEDMERAIVAALQEPDRQAVRQAIAGYRAERAAAASPAERGVPFRVPRLVTEIQGTFELADPDVFTELHEWSLLDHPAALDETEFAIRETAHTFEIDVDGDHVRYQRTGEEEQLGFDVNVDGWTPEALVAWLDRQVRQPDIHPSELLRWLSDLVGHLTGPRGIHISALMRCKFILARKVRDKLAEFGRQEQQAAYQRWLIAPEARVEISFDHAFEFKDDMYADVQRYRGRWKPTKHFLGPDRVPAFDGAQHGEEVQCAEAIDALPDLAHWLRNVARHPQSFRLPLANGNFYPDFVAELEDGRSLVIEYKGAHLADGPDTDEKRTVGHLWEKTSGGRCLFLMVEREVDGKDVRAQITEKIKT